MMPILYEKSEMDFTSNGLGRLRDCLSCIVTEERNGIYECDFEYPVDGAHFDEIRCGRIIAVEHDYSNDVQPFDIVSYSKPIDGIVSFHAVHISYRQSYMTVSGKNINSLSDAFTLLGNAQPSNPFRYWTDKTGTSGYMAAADGVPRSVRQMLGGVEGSILDTYRGEYEWDKFTVKLWNSRGSVRNITIRYGLNMLDYSEETDYSESYTSVIPYWVGDNGSGTEVVVKASRVDSGATSYNGRNDCVPMDLSEKFETKPTTTQLRNKALSLMTSGQTNLPSRSITIDFVRLQDTMEYQGLAPLMKCGLCDSVKVVFSRYGMSGIFKIVRTVYNVLLEKFDEVELGTLQTSLADAMGISGEGTFSGGSGSLIDMFYPIGSYYETSDTSFDPNVAWDGTTWVLETAGQVHVSAGTGYTVGGALTNTSDGGTSDAPVMRHGHTISAGDLTTSGMSGNATHSHTPYTSTNRFPSYNYGTVNTGVTNRKVAAASSGNYTAVTVNNANADWSAHGSTASASVAHTHTVPASNYTVPKPTNSVDPNETPNTNFPPFIVVNRWHRVA